MDAPYYNGGPEDIPIGNADGPDRWKCLDCPAAGKGYVSRGKHWHATRHHIVAGFDPRAKHAPRVAAKDKDPATETMVGDGQGRR